MKSTHEHNKSHLRDVKHSSIVIDIGESYSKCGFAGDSYPMHIFRTGFIFQLQGSMMRRNQSKTEGDWKNIIYILLKTIFYDKMQINIKDKDKHRRVIICENPFWPRAFRSALARTLFDMEVSSVLFAPFPTLPLYTTGKTTGLVFDIGYGESRILPIYQGHPIGSAFIAMPLGMIDLCNAMKKELSKTTSDKSLQTSEVPNEILEDIIVRLCMVRPLNIDELHSASLQDKDIQPDNLEQLKKKQKIIETIPDASYTTQGYNYIVSSQVRVKLADTLFGQNEEHYNLGYSVLESLLKCSLEARAAVIQNFVICGGVSLLPGFITRLLQEVNCALSLRQFSPINGLINKFKLSPENSLKRNSLHWAGASVLASLPLNDSYFVTLDQYNIELKKTISDPDPQRLSQE